MSDITLGIIGSGQLGSLLCQAAKKLNVKTVVISDDEQGPAQNYSNEFIYSKFLRLFIFILLLINGFSIYHLLFTNILLRAFLFFRIINFEKAPINILLREKII